MKFRLTMKDPDTLNDAISDAVAAEVAAIEGISDDERVEIERIRHASVAKIASRWFKHGEYLTVEIDTKEDTATVIVTDFWNRL